MTYASCSFDLKISPSGVRAMPLVSKVIKVKAGDAHVTTVEHLLDQMG